MFALFRQYNHLTIQQSTIISPSPTDKKAKLFLKNPLGMFVHWREQRKPFQKTHFPYYKSGQQKNPMPVHQNTNINFLALIP